MRATYWPTEGWRTSKPKAQGMDPRVLAQINDYVDKTPPSVRSVVVVRNGYIVFEEYYKGNEDEAQPIFSVTKSVTSALVGIAFKEGYLESLDQKMVGFFPDYVTEKTDPRMHEITLRHLLTMRSGFAAEPVVLRIERTLSEPVPWEPGQRSVYLYSVAHLLSGIITKATGMSALEFGDRHLFGPLGISTPVWEADPDGYNNGADALYLRSRDMAKIGYLYLKGGVWDGEQIVPTEWVAQSTRKHTETPIPSWRYKADYGYLWWVTSVDGHEAFMACGLGGQYIYVIPELEIVVVITSDARDMDTAGNIHIVDKLVVPAVLA